jgi:hypothetical protein
MCQTRPSQTHRHGYVLAHVMVCRGRSLFDISEYLGRSLLTYREQAVHTHKRLSLGRVHDVARLFERGVAARRRVKLREMWRAHFARACVVQRGLALCVYAYVCM